MGGLLLLCLVAACRGGGTANGDRYLAEAVIAETVEVTGELPVFGTNDPGPQTVGDVPAKVEVEASRRPSPSPSDEPSSVPALAVLADGPPPAAVGVGAGLTDPGLRRATFAFSGDTLPHSPLVNAARRTAAEGGGGAAFDFSPMFARVAPVISAADYGVCHLETPIAPPGTQLSTYPMYGVPGEVTNALATAGYDRCSTASNHTVDRGVAGIDATVNALEAVGLTQAGMARTPEEAVVALIDVNGIAIAHLSFTMNLNGGRLPADQPWRSNIIDGATIIAAAHDARARGAEVVIVSLHWGTERVSAPNRFQVEIADAVTRSGQVDLIVGHHAHVIQPIEQVNGRWVVFGMGNFLSNMPTGDSWPASSQDGMIVNVAISEQADGQFVVERPSVVPTWVDRGNGFVIRPVLSDLADPAVSDSVKRQLAASLDRTRAVVGDFVVVDG